MLQDSYPYGLNFQQSVTSLILRDPTFLPCYSEVIKPKYFESPVYSALVRIVVDFFEEKGEVPSYEVLKILVHDYASINKEVSSVQLLNTLDKCYATDLTDQDVITQKMVEFGKRKVVEQMLLDVSSMLTSGKSADSIWQRIDAVRELGSASVSAGVNIGASLLNGDEILRSDGLYNESMKVGTGLPTLDLAFNGGLARKEVGIVLGYTNAGKSTFLVNLGAAAIKQRLPVIHCLVGEMDEVDVLARYMSCLLGVKVADVVSGRAENYKNRAREFVETFQPKAIAKYFSPYTPVSTIRSFISRCKYKLGINPALIVIDNADDLTSSKRHSDAYEEQGQVYTDLKAIAHDFNVAIWADSQTNRTGKSAEFADLDIIADSHKKARKSDVVISINQRPDDYSSGRMKIYVAKARRYSKLVNVVHCFVDYSVMQVRENVAANASANGGI